MPSEVLPDAPKCFVRERSWWGEELHGHTTEGGALVEAVVQNQADTQQCSMEWCVRVSSHIMFCQGHSLQIAIHPKASTKRSVEILMGGRSCMATPQKEVH